MKSSRAITLTLLSATMLTACCCALPRMVKQPADRTWYDANHQPIAEQWRTNADGTREPLVMPYDAYGQPWVRHANGEWGPQDPPAHVSSTTHHSSPSLWPLLFWNRSGYRSGSGFSSTSHNSYSPSRSSTSSSISRGGFGSTASAHASSSGG